MDVVGLVQVEKLVGTLLSLEERVADNVIHEAASEVLLFDGVLVYGACPSLPLQPCFDDLDLRELLLGLEVALCLVVPGVDEQEKVLQRVGAAEEVLQHRLVQFVGQE